jgi:hypothetical protein
MQSVRLMLVKSYFCLAVIVLCGISVAADTAANVAGTWSVSASDGGRKADQTLVIQQDGNKITGTFKGPMQSGTLEGTVTGNAITFHVKARRALDYTGSVDGDSMKGTLSGGGKTGDWTATRSK